MTKVSPRVEAERIQKALDAFGPPLRRATDTELYQRAGQMLFALADACGITHPSNSPTHNARTILRAIHEAFPAALCYWLAEGWHQVNRPDETHFWARICSCGHVERSLGDPRTTDGPVRLL